MNYDSNVNVPDGSFSTQLSGDNIAVVYLLVRELGPDSFKKFITSYRDIDPGLDHKLIIAVKQFSKSDDELNKILKVAADINYELIFVPDGGYDIGSYQKIVSMTKFEKYCFINSNTELKSEKWLNYLIKALDLNKKSVVGFSGSMQSLASDALVLEIEKYPSMLITFRRYFGYIWLRRHFPKFPNPHIRSNLFAIRRQDFLDLTFPIITRKYDTWKFESGRMGLSAQIKKNGGRLIVVDNKGNFFGPSSWSRSQTFWQFDQENLLASDKQTRMYDNAQDNQKMKLFSYAWQNPKLPDVKVFGVYFEYIILFLALFSFWGYLMLKVVINLIRKLI